MSVKPVAIQYWDYCIFNRILKQQLACEALCVYNPYQGSEILYGFESLNYTMKGGKKHFRAACLTLLYIQIYKKGLRKKL